MSARDGSGGGRDRPWLAVAVAVGLLGALLATTPAFAGARLVKDIAPGRDSSDLSNLEGHEGALYFSANDHRLGFELWRSDGSLRGTRLVDDIVPGRGWSSPQGPITSAGDTLFFTVRCSPRRSPAGCGEVDTDPHGFTGELWKSDGTASGTGAVLPGESLQAANLSAAADHSRS